MQCPQCQHKNSEAAKFCEECGTKLAQACPVCGQKVNPRAKFCPECGTPLTSKPKGKKQKKQTTLGSRPWTPDSRSVSYTPLHLAQRTLAEQAAMEARSVTDGEHKTITALFANIQGSMELIENLDPEEARSLIDPALKLMMGAVHRYEGYAAQSTGDGIFAFSGALIAHEDHPRWALYAALSMQEDIKRYVNQLRLEGRRPVEVRSA